jgi:hypothetical protein
MCCAHNGIHVVECHIVEGALLWHPAVATCESLTPYTLALRRICLEYPVGNPVFTADTLQAFLVLTTYVLWPDPKMPRHI